MFIPALVLRGLDALTTEDAIVTAMSQVSYSTVKNIRIIRDETTNTSRGYGFLELNSVSEATRLLDQLSHNPLEVDGKQLLVSYAKNTFSTVYVPFWLFVLAEIIHACIVMLAIWTEIGIIIQLNFIHLNNGNLVPP